MPLEIRNTPFNKRLYGISKPILEGQKPVEVMFAAMDEMWRRVRASQVPNRGINHILYSGNTSVFAGVEVDGDVPAVAGLQPVDVHFSRYAYYRHIGPYTQLPLAYQEIDRELAARDLRTTADSMEIYGHASQDPEKQVTEILIGLSA